MRTMIVAVALLLAGCGTPSPPGKALEFPAEWSQCRWAYPNGEPMRCDGDSKALHSAAHDATWICTYEQSHTPSGLFFLLLYSPLHRQHAVYVEGPKPISGQMTFNVDGQPRLFNWTGTTTSAFMPMGESLLEATDIRYAVYYSFINTTDPRLQDAIIHQAWSWHDGDEWVVHHLQTPRGTALFHNVTRTPFGDETSSQTVFMRNDGYSLAIYMRYVLGGMFDRAPVTTVNSACTDHLPAVGESVNGGGDPINALPRP